MDTSQIRQARTGDEQELVAMQSLLWPDASRDELRLEVEAAIDGRAPGALPSVLLVAQGEAGTAAGAAEHGGLLAGFVAVGLRSHADGCDPERPVGFIEGWFVREALRGRGIGG